jgi:serine/threonine protein phosphatase PrpC
MHLTVEVAGRTDTGCIRSNNEDAFGFDSKVGIFVVCDGMGGAAAGEVASQIGVDCVLSHFSPASISAVFSGMGDVVNGGSNHSHELACAIRFANNRILESAIASPQRAGMGTTIVAALFHNRTVSIAHVGDSRIYLIRNGNIQQLTVDHSLVTDHVRLGFISRDEAGTSGLQNVITRALGTEKASEPDLAEVSILPHDVLLLCTDGLTRHVTDSQLSELVGNAPSIDTACKALIDAARAQGGSDNITCVLVGFVPIPWYRRLFRAKGQSARP